MPIDDGKFDQVAHQIATEIYTHMEEDRVKDDFITWFDMGLLAIALIMMTLLPYTAAPMTIVPNVAVKGYQIARRYHRTSKRKKEATNASG
jgi:hypothetical protein